MLEDLDMVVFHAHIQHYTKMVSPIKSENTLLENHVLVNPKCFKYRLFPIACFTELFSLLCIKANKTNHKKTNLLYLICRGTIQIKRHAATQDPFDKDLISFLNLVSIDFCIYQANRPAATQPGMCFGLKIMEAKTIEPGHY